MLLFVCGCDAGRSTSGNSGSGWAGTERDSAGVRLIENPSAGIWSAATTWRIERDFVVGEGGAAPPPEFGRIVDLDVAADGRIYVLDQQAAQIRVFDDAGAPLFSFGRAGEGPGEFSSENPFGAQAVLLTGTGELLVPDRVNGRVSRFSPDGTFIGSFPLGLDAGEPVISGVDAEGNFLMHRVERTTGGWNGVLRFDADGLERDTLLTFAVRPDPWSMTTPDAAGRRPLLVHHPLWAAFPDGTTVSGHSAEYRIEVRAPDGTLKQVISKDTGDPAISRDERRDYMERVVDIWADMFRRRGESEEWIDAQLMNARNVYLPPERLPAFTGFAPGPDGTIWVRRPLPPSEISAHLLSPRLPLREFWSAHWDVFSGDGRFLGEIALPERFTLYRVRDEFIYGVETDDLGVQRVSRLRVRTR